MDPLFSLSGRVALVTGGCGQLGSQYTVALVTAGARVAVVDKVVRDVPVLAPRIADGTVIVYECDITDKPSVERVYAKIEKEMGTPSILVNNAGIDAPPHTTPAETGPFEEYPETSWDAVIDSHLKGAFLMSQAFVRVVKAAGLSSASIINVSSTYGVVTPDQSLYQYRRDRGETFFKPVAYSVAKSGMLNFTRWLAEYGAPYHIRVNTFVPGGVFNNQEQAFLDGYAKRVPLGRMARADEYNGAIVFLASDASSYMTGSTVTADGGWTAR